jgi:tetratricopeptide (TPR) repeat protein
LIHCDYGLTCQSIPQQAAFNAIENYEDAEIDCSRALKLNKSHLKAWYRRAIARKGLGRLDEAEQGGFHLSTPRSRDHHADYGYCHIDMLQLLSQAPNIQAATAELAAIRKEIEDMKKREEVDEVD